MIQTNIKNEEYIGPKALFDPTFIPPKLLYRKKEENILGSILSDSISDNFSLNILYQGIKGIGKKSLIIKVLNDSFLKKKNNSNLAIININCLNKTMEEILFTLLIEANKHLACNINIKSLLNSNLSHLWTTFKLAVRKSNNYVLLVFTNIDNLNAKSFRKILQYGKESRIPIITTANKVLKCSTLDLLQEFDLKKNLSYFSYAQLERILNQRVDLAFSHQIEDELISYLTDLIFEYYVPVPGKGVDILKALYPFSMEEGPFNQGEVLKISKTQFDAIPTFDEINLFSYISERDIITLLFLDNLANHFEYTPSYYITGEELKELFLLSLESIEYSFEKERYQKIIRMLQNIGILSKSKDSDLPDSKYFMIIDKDQLKLIIDTCFKSPTESN